MISVSMAVTVFNQRRVEVFLPNCQFYASVAVNQWNLETRRRPQLSKTRKTSAYLLTPMPLLFFSLVESIRLEELKGEVVVVEGS